MKKTITISSVILLLLLILLLFLKFCDNSEQINDQQENGKSVPELIPAIKDSIEISPEDTISTATDIKSEKKIKKPREKREQKNLNSELALVRNSLYTLNRFTTSLTPIPQIFYVSSKEITTITGDKGTSVVVDPAVLEAYDGTKPGDSIRIELVEILDQRDMILNDVNTMAGDSVLISDGMFRIEMFASGKKLNIIDGEMMDVIFPVDIDEDMELFYGVPDSTGSPDWVLVDPINSIPEAKYEIGIQRIDENGNDIEDYSQTVEELNRQRFHRGGLPDERSSLNRFSIRRLGWFNIDKFLARNAPRSVLTINYNGDLVKAVKCYLVFLDLNANISSTFNYSPFNKVYPALPARQNIKVLAIGYRDTIPFISNEDVFISRELSHELKFKQTTEENILDEIDKIR